LGALATQLFDAGSDRHKVIGGARPRPGTLLLHTRSDRREIVGSTDAGHVSSVS
jgi:hypothetical protein